MFDKLTIAITALWLFTACADPKYVSRESTPQIENQEKVAVADIVWPQSNLSIWLKWELMPTEEKFGSFILKIGHPNSADRTPVLQDIEGDVAVVLWMPSMGHGSSPITVERIDVGTYRASKVFFTMPGDWEIRVQRKSGGLILEQAALAIRL